jgi:hypothetical protein
MDQHHKSKLQEIPHSQLYKDQVPFQEGMLDSEIIGRPY